MVLEPQTWREKLAQQWWRIKVADNALQLAKDQSRQKLVNRLVRWTQDLAFNGMKSTRANHAAATEADDLGVHVGDLHQHYHGGPKSAGSGLLGKLLLTAAAATGIGTPLAGIALWKLPEILRALKPAPPASVDQDTDTDTAFGLEVGSIEDVKDQEAE